MPTNGNPPGKLWVYPWVGSGSNFRHRSGTGKHHRVRVSELKCSTRTPLFGSPSKLGNMGCPCAPGRVPFVQNLTHFDIKEHF